MDSNVPPTEKKGLGPLAWIGIGCGSIVALAVIGFIAVTVIFGGKIKQFAEDAQKDPTRAMANTMVTMSAGQLEMVAQDEPAKRYTIKEKSTGKLTTIYWSESKKAPEVVEGDFSKIPAPTDAGAAAPAPEPAAAAPPAAPAPAQQ